MTALSPTWTWPASVPLLEKTTSITDRAIMPDVTVGEKISAVADACFSVARRAAVDGNEFAKRIFIADLQIGRLALIFQVLCLLADRAVGVKFVSARRRAWARKA